MTVRKSGLNARIMTMPTATADTETMFGNVNLGTGRKIMENGKMRILTHDDNLSDKRDRPKVCELVLQRLRRGRIIAAAIASGG